MDGAGFRAINIPIFFQKLDTKERLQEFINKTNSVLKSLLNEKEMEMVYSFFKKQEQIDLLKGYIKEIIEKKYSSMELLKKLQKIDGIKPKIKYLNNHPAEEKSFCKYIALLSQVIQAKAMILENPDGFGVHVIEIINGLKDFDNGGYWSGDGSLTFFCIEFDIKLIFILEDTFSTEPHRCIEKQVKVSEKKDKVFYSIIKRINGNHFNVLLLDGIK